MRLKIGQLVRFKDKVFKSPYAPYYDAYKGHTFKVVKFHDHKFHVEVVCVDSNIEVKGHVHPDELH